MKQWINGLIHWINGLIHWINGLKQFLPLVKFKCSLSEIPLACTLLCQCSLKLYSISIYIGYKTLEEELQCVLIKPMKKLYFHWNDNHNNCVLRFTCCPTVQPCTLALSSLYFLSGRAEIFHRVWKENLSSLS